jgi:hypothetical protein
MSKTCYSNATVPLNEAF